MLDTYNDILSLKAFNNPQPVLFLLELILSKILKTQSLKEFNSISPELFRSL